MRLVDVKARVTTIREAVRAVLALFEQPKSDDEALVQDRLVAAVHDARFTFDDTEYPEAPRLAYEAARALVVSRFPDFGPYSVPASMLPGTTELILGDAVDDLADLIIELRDVEWRFEHTSEADALWQLENGFRTHWAAHVRWLQVFLLERQFRVIRTQARARRAARQVVRS